MDNKIRNRKKIVFMLISFFFFFSMLFLFINISQRMYSNASIILSIKETKNLQKILLTSIDFDSRSPNIEKNLSKIVNIIKSLNSYPPVYYVKIYSKNKKLLYNWGREVDLEKRNSINNILDKNILYNKTIALDSGNEAYEVIFSLKNNDVILGYGEILFDLTSIENNLFKERRIIFMIVFMFNFFILLFLIINILNLYKRNSYLEKEINSVSTIDPVSGIYTKPHFFKLMKKEINRIEQNDGKATLLIADIDNFFSINEKYGFEFGDLIFQTVAKILTGNFRNFDILGKFGGDEIIILMVDSTEEDAYQVAEKCRLSVEENKFYYSSEEITITISFGISSTNNIKTSFEKGKNYFKNLTFNSLGALAKAKRDGRNRSIKHSEI